MLKKYYILIMIFTILIISSKQAFSKRINTQGNSIKKVDVTKNVSLKWKPLLNSKEKEFWREGNHLPDEGFVLFAQDPTSIHQAKLWLLRMETKAKIINQMQKTIELAQKEMIKDGLIEDRYWQFEDLKKGNISSRVSKNDLGKLNYYFLFSSTCSHCKELASKLHVLPRVRPLQVDKLKILSFKGLTLTTRATSKTIASYLPDGIVPVVVIHNPKTNTLTKISGNRPIEEYFLASKSLLKGEK